MIQFLKNSVAFINFTFLTSYLKMLHQIVKKQQQQKNQMGSNTTENVDHATGLGRKFGRTAGRMREEEG